MEQMTLAQALREVASIKGKIDDWKDRMQPAVFFTDDDPPAFEFTASRAAMNELVKRMIELQTSIAIANATTMMEWQDRSIPLSLAVRTLAELKGSIKRTEDLMVRNTKSGADKKSEVDYDEDGKRFTRKSERPWMCALTTAEKSKLVDDLKSRFSKLNDAVETVNHKTLIAEVSGLSDASV